MKLNSKTKGSFFSLLLLGIFMGTLFWELAELLLSRLGIEMDLTIGPAGVNLDFLQVYIKLNPGSLLGLIFAILLFRRI
jgi:hypothetical protein